MPYDHTAPTTAEAKRRIWELACAQRVCMMTTWDGHKQHARPMTPHSDQGAGCMYFLDKHDSAKETEMKKFPAIGLTFSDASGNTYVAMSGRGTVSNDRGLIKKLWSAAYKTWWDSENDPSIRVITFSAEQGEMWDGPNRLVAGAIMLMNAVTGSHLELGTNAKSSF